MELDDLGSRIQTWLNAQDQKQFKNFMVVGGGTSVDRIRALNSLGHFSNSESHLTSFRIMDSNANFLADKLRMGIRPATSIHDFGSFDKLPNVTFLKSADFLIAKSPQPSWEFTSDSAALILTKQLKASECILLKSTLSEVNGALVDESFAKIAESLPSKTSIRVVNLRSSTFEDVVFPKVGYSG